MLAIQTRVSDLHYELHTLPACSCFVKDYLKYYVLAVKVN